MNDVIEAAMATEEDRRLLEKVNGIYIASTVLIANRGKIKIPVIEGLAL